MEEWEQPHWSGKPQPKADTRPKLRPNLFARVARSCARNASAVFMSFLFLCALTASYAAVTLEIDPAARPQILLDVQTLAAQGQLDRNFPGIDETIVAMIEMADADAARGTALATAAALSKRSDLFTSAFVPGTGDFYTKFGILFRDAADIDAKVAFALRMQPLYYALGSAPDVTGLAALTTEIGRAVAQGRSPPGLNDLLLAASASFEGEVSGVSQPIPWTQLAGLSATVDSTRWFVIAVPVPGSERAAASFASAATKQLTGLSWYFPPDAYSFASNIVRDLIVPAVVAGLVLLTMLGMGLGAAKFAVPVLIAVTATVCLTAGVAALVTPGLDAVSWSFAAACMAPALLFAIVLVLAHVQSRVRGSEPMAALMLAAHRRGGLLLALMCVAEVFWLIWLARQLPSLAQTAVAAAAGIVLAFVVVLTLVPAALAALDKGGDVPVHWLDAEVAQPLDNNLRNAGQLLVLVLIAASVFCGVFVPGLRFGDAAVQQGPMASLDMPVARDAVHFIVEPGVPALRMIEKLVKLPETGAIRSIEQFLPTGTSRKLQALRQLESILAVVPAPRDPPDAISLTAAFNEIETGLLQIAVDQSAAPELRDAASRLRRAIEIYTNPELPAPGRVAALEDALFSGLGGLTHAANQLAKLNAPVIADLDEGLRRRFVSSSGQWRIEVLPKAGVSRLNFAAAMRKFSTGAAGVPIVALARNEIMHHETAVALAIALAVVAATILVFMRSLRDMVLSLVPLLFAISLTSAVIATTGQVLVPSVLAAAMIAIAACLSMSIILVLRARGRSSVSDTSFRAALLPPLALLATVAPLAISTNPAVAGFGLISTLFLGVGIFVNLIVVPQGSAWMGGLQRK